MVRWGLISGAVLGALVLALHRVLPPLFTGDPEVRSAIAAALIVVALGQPLSGFVFVVDGVLIGAGDARWLARAMVLVLVAYVPIVLVVREALPADASAPTAMMWLWVAFTAFMAIRAAFFWWRVRTDHWLVLGATR